jgi:antitoxin VapB
MQKVTAKLFKNGGSRAVRIPAAWGFDEDEVTLTFDETNRQITISEAPTNWLETLFRMQEEFGLQGTPGWPERNQPIDTFKNPFDK